MIEISDEEVIWKLHPSKKKKVLKKKRESFPVSETFAQTRLPWSRSAVQSC